ncbi:MAG: P-loop NTPase [Planctomycetes bacterium]|nr:P-loop NTPase [Planctomycetota bacterium]
MSTSTTKESIVQALRSVKDPNSNRDIASAGYVRGVSIEDGVARITLQIPSEAATQPLQRALSEQTQAAVGRLSGVRSVEVEFELVATRATSTLPGVRDVVAVGAGKGGVGKSTISVLLAYGLRRLGKRTGILDADVYGPSIPKLTGTEGAQPMVDEQGWLVPPTAGDGMPIMSMGYLISPDQAVVWRGPMAQKYVKEFLDRGRWGELDHLIVDLPPGTGDIPLTLAQSIPLTGAVIVCTPQDVALLDAIKAIRMYEKLGVPTPWRRSTAWCASWPSRSTSACANARRCRS